MGDDSRKRQRPVPTSRSKASRDVRRSKFEEETARIRTEIAELDPSSPPTSFAELPLSHPTSTGLARAGFRDMTDIQKLSLPKSLAGKDVLAAAPTGSGKTLAFVIPVLERLYQLRWSTSDGLGALIISPTRELAIQIFDVLRKVGAQHQSLSAGIVFGGKNFKDEATRIPRLNILVATPGRLRQHLEQTPGFDPSNVQIFVLDEADRNLDMGFEDDLNGILEQLPRKPIGGLSGPEQMGRQTLLFSATQTNKVSDLARLSLDHPEFVAVKSVTEAAAARRAGALGDDTPNRVLPEQLSQHYMLVDLHRKLDLLYSFIRSHVKTKIVVFFSACREVQFVFETFCKLRPGLPLLCLHGKQKQGKRLQIFSEFGQMKNACLFATDIAARGLDFPSVDWVLQVDAPEDGDTYVHRVGRTARYNKAGNSLMFVMPEEKDLVLRKLASRGIRAAENGEEASGSAIRAIKPREGMIQSISSALQSFLFQDPPLKYLGQKAFVSYVRSLFLMKERKDFDIVSLPLDSYAESLGLAGAPKVKFVTQAQKEKTKQARIARAEAKKNANVAKRHGLKTSASDSEDRHGDEKDGEEDSENEEDGEPADEVQSQAPAQPKVRTKYDRMFERKNDDVLTSHYQTMVDSDQEDDGQTQGFDVGEDEGDDVFQLARANHALEGADSDVNEDEAREAATNNLSKRALKQGMSKKAMAQSGKRGMSKKLTFDNEGEAHELYELQDEDEFKNAGDAAEQAAAHAQIERERLNEQDVADRERVREQRREKRRLQKEREREAHGAARDGVETQAVLPSDAEDNWEEPDWILPGDEGYPDGGSSRSESDSSSSDQSDAGIEETQERPRKRARRTPTSTDPGASLADDEALALQLLGD